MDKLYLQILANWEKIKNNIREACIKVGREDFPRVVVASKYMDTEQIRILYQIGLRDFGENQIQSSIRKITELAELDINWHFIGHLQKNKVNKFLGLPFCLLHSVDRFDLIDKLSERLAKISKQLDCLIELNLSKEESKFGFCERDLACVIKRIEKLPNLNCIGIMTMAPYTDNFSLIRKIFKRAKSLCDEFGLTELSMGMSNDYKIAVEEGATILRIGSAFLVEN